MALTLQDLINGVDFTGLVEATGQNHNELVSGAYPVSDTNGDGKGLVLFSNDTALDTPHVPDPDVIDTKWKRYIWVRVPHNTATSKVPIIYCWGDNCDSDATYLKWQQLTGENSSIQDQIDAIDAIADNALSTAQTANLTANNANAIATDAKSDALTADTNAAIGIANAAAAQLKAEDAYTLAGTANAAAVAAAAKRAVNNVLLPGLANQKIRTNEGATAVEWYNEGEYYAKISNRQPRGTDLANVAAGVNRRYWNTIDTGAYIISLTDLDGGGKGYATFQFLKTGTYKINAIIPAGISGASGANLHQAILRQYVDGTPANDTVIATGTVGQVPAVVTSGLTMYSHIIGAVVVNDVSKKYYIDSYIVRADGKLGHAASFADVDVEVYNQMEIQKLQ